MTAKLMVQVKKERCFCQAEINFGQNTKNEKKIWTEQKIKRHLFDQNKKCSK